MPHRPSRKPAKDKDQTNPFGYKTNPAPRAAPAAEGAQPPKPHVAGQKIANKGQRGR